MAQACFILVEVLAQLDFDLTYPPHEPSFVAAAAGGDATDPIAVLEQWEAERMQEMSETEKSTEKSQAKKLSNGNDALTKADAEYGLIYTGADGNTAITSDGQLLNTPGAIDAYKEDQDEKAFDEYTPQSVESGAEEVADANANSIGSSKLTSADDGSMAGDGDGGGGGRIIGTTITYTEGKSTDFINSNLGDKASIELYGGTVTGKPGFLNTNTTFSNGQLSSYEASVGPVSLGLDVKNGGIFQSVSVKGYTFSGGFSVFSGFSGGLSHSSGPSIFGVNSSFRPGGYSALGAAIIYFAPSLIPATPFLLPQLR